ncbi:MAG TPA: hypothetical protein VM101_13495 [Flavitalea sp.]|nr:hypothetical protein [Flavitalea sp.]
MAALDKYLITKTDIITYRPTAVLDDTRIKPFILEAQRLDLEPVLNAAFYYDFVYKFDATGDSMYTAYQNLLIGTTYTYGNLTIQFDGVKPMLVYFALSRFITANILNITRMSVTVKTVDQSQTADTAQLKMMVNELRSVALGYQQKVIQYLENNSTTYPLYNTGGASENAGTKTSFNFFAV